MGLTSALLGTRWDHREAAGRGQGKGVTSCATNLPWSVACIINLYQNRVQCIVPLQVSPEFKAKILALLRDGGFEELRASKMSQEELLALLAAFNAAGVHFA